MAFQGWPAAALGFYEGLEQDNSRACWTAHTAIYDEAVLGPMTELTDELTGEFGAVKIFRPYRDIRFSADKLPYRTELGATVGTAGCPPAQDRSERRIPCRMRSSPS